MSRIERAKAAQETIEIFKRGYYFVDGSKVDCQSKYSTRFLPEEQLDTLAPPLGSYAPRYEVVNESVVDTVVRYGSESCGVLNFASAKNPGGGFLNGSLAQEEALAVSSDLYISQLEAIQLYEINRRGRSLLYTHNMIYSQGITFIRDGKMGLLSSSVAANILTAPAVNAGAYYQNEKGSKGTVLTVMEKRMRYILNVFAAMGDRTVILGAYGCGVFRNDTADVADIFYRLLKDEEMERFFERIVFAVYDPRGQQYGVFEERFGGRQ